MAILRGLVLCKVILKIMYFSVLRSVNETA